MNKKSEYRLPKHRIKRIKLILALILGIIIAYILLFRASAHNNEYVSIKRQRNFYELILTGERVYMSHDLISLIHRDVYADTIVLRLPRNNGIVKGNEIVNEDRYTFEGNLKIKNGIVTVELFYVNFDDATKDLFSYNGSYKLK